jgi:hypothetical protein
LIFKGEIRDYNHATFVENKPFTRMSFPFSQHFQRVTGNLSETFFGLNCRTHKLGFWGLGFLLSHFSTVSTTADGPTGM